MGRKLSTVVISTKNSIPRRLANKKKIIAVASLGIICLVVPVLLFFIDPIFIIAMLKLRFTKGSMLHDLLIKEMEAARLEVHVFNATNAEQFVSGEDQKLRVQEVGPFVYQEYRTNENLELDLEAGVVRFIPRFRAAFVEEESIGRPEETMVVAPNVPYISTSSLFSSYPAIVKSVYKMWVGQLNPKAITTIDVHKILWGYRDSIIDLCKSLIPGVVYYDSIGIFDRLYDDKADYRIEMDITNKRKFQVRSVMKTLRGKSWNSSDLIETKMEFQDTYEGAAFPSQMTPQMPVNIYRTGICRTLGWEYVGQKTIKLGADAFEYHLSNKTFENSRLCSSQGWCPEGVIDLSYCFYGIPIAITKTHLLDVDPKFLDRVDGIHPDREKHASYLLIEPKIGLTVETSLSLQLNLLLGDMRFMPDLAKFSDMLLPLAYVKLTLPELPDATKNSLSLLYVTGPRILLGLEIVLWVLGLVLIAYSLKLARRECCRRKKLPTRPDSKLKTKISAELPLIS